jgi:hypothetical protein
LYPRKRRISLRFRLLRHAPRPILRTAGATSSRSRPQRRDAEGLCDSSLLPCSAFSGATGAPPDPRCYAHRLRGALHSAHCCGCHPPARVTRSVCCSGASAERRIGRSRELVCPRTPGCPPGARTCRAAHPRVHDLTRRLHGAGRANRRRGLLVGTTSRVMLVMALGARREQFQTPRRACW